ncbi:hypothetical protein JCM3774_006173 [Rhodotorula dairenensis]
MAFKRPFHAQSRTPVRSSDLRRFRDALGAQFPTLAAQPDLLKRLTKDLQVCKAATHLDEPCTLYLAPNGDPRFFTLDHRPGLVPTCYTTDLWLPADPRALPLLATAESVVHNLVSGSALFAAGVSPAHLARLVHRPDAPREGSLVAITVADDPTLRVVAVGYLAADPNQIQLLQRADKGGKAVITLHARGDFLWQAGSKVDIPLADADAIADPDADPDVELADRLAATTVVDGDPADVVPTKDKTKRHRNKANGREPKQLDSSEEEKEEAQGKQSTTPAAAAAAAAQSTPLTTTTPAAELSPSEVDSILLNALLLALSTSPALQTATTFPLAASSLYSAYILPSRPASPPSHAQVDLKKSSFKKLDRFVKLAVKKGYLSAKELKKGSGDWIVTSVENRHPDAEKVPRYKTVAAGQGDASGSASTTTTTAAAAAALPAGLAGNTRKNGGDEGVHVRELYKLSGDGVKELFRSVPHERPPHDLYTTSDLSSLLRQYTDLHSLSHPSHRSLLMIHPSAFPSSSPCPEQTRDAVSLLARCVCGTKVDPTEVGREKGSPGCVTRDEALKRIKKEGCTAYWGLTRPGAGADEVVKKGTPPTVKVTIKNVGKRQVTLISGHEPWDLFTSEELAEKLKHASASSTSIQPLAGSAKKGQTPKVEIMCQGTHDALVTKVLAAFGVPKAYIEVDLSKSKK